ncbi:hypothetical protein N7519_003218, partial [Penicillium mononematosum]|uniref:uncharacterized protein n=1 Tax=Penicillium mononematosum TaxID=268346 RepID=UPI002549B601
RKPTKYGAAIFPPPPKLTPLSSFSRFPLFFPKASRHRLLLSVYLLFLFLILAWTSFGLEISFRVTVKYSHWNGCAAHSSLLHAN